MHCELSDTRSQFSDEEGNLVLTFSKDEYKLLIPKFDRRSEVNIRNTNAKRSFTFLYFFLHLTSTDSS